MKIKNLIILGFGLLALSVLSVKASSRYNFVALEADDHEAVSDSAVCYYASAGACNMSDEGCGKIRMYLECLNGDEWTVLDSEAVSEDTCYFSSTWGRSERDTLYTMRVRLVAIWNFEYGFYGRTGIGSLDAEIPD